MGRSSRTKRDAGEKVAQRHILYFGVFMVADPSLADVRIQIYSRMGRNHPLTGDHSLVIQSHSVITR